MADQDWSPDMNKLLAAYAHGPEVLREALATLDNEALDLAPPDGGWTIRKIVHHLADGDDLWKTCILAALGQGGEQGGAAERAVFALQWYWDRPQDEWVELWAYSQRAIEPSLALLEANRRRTVQLLCHTPNPLARCITVRWPGGREQEVTVAWVVEMQTQHVAGHIEDILRIRDAYTVPGV